MKSGYHSVAQGHGTVGVRLVGGGAEVEIAGCGYTRVVLVPSGDVGWVARALRAGEIFEIRGAGSALWTRKTSRPGWLLLSAATEMMYCDMQYPSVEIGPKVAAKLADMIDPNPLAGARRRADDNLRGVFGG